MTLRAKISSCKNALLTRKPSITIYDVFRPIFRVCILIGMTPFDVRGDKFKSSTCLVIFNVSVAITFTGLGMMDLVKRTFVNRLSLISDITDFLLAWNNLFNDTVIIVCGCIYRNQVGRQCFSKLRKSKYNC